MKGKKLLLTGLAVALVFCFSGLARAQSPLRPRRRTQKKPFTRLIQAKGKDQIYSLFEGKKYPIPHNEEDENYEAAIMDSWGWEDMEVKQLPSRLVDRFPTMENVTMRPGTYLLYLDCAIYAVEYRGRLRRFTLEALPLLYGDNWINRVVTLPEENKPDYFIYDFSHEIGVVMKQIFGGLNPVPTDIPQGSILPMTKYSGGDPVTTWGRLVGEECSKTITTEGLFANKFKKKFFLEKYPACWIPSIAPNNPIVDYHPELDFISNQINMATIDNINTGFGPKGTFMSYEWHNHDGGLPLNVKEGDFLTFIYDDGGVKVECTSEVIASPSYSYWPYLYCNVEWPEHLPCFHARQNYKVFKK